MLLLSKSTAQQRLNQFIAEFCTHNPDWRTVATPKYWQKLPRSTDFVVLAKKVGAVELLLVVNAYFEKAQYALYFGWTNMLPLPQIPPFTPHRSLKDLTLGEHSDEFTLPFFCRDYQHLHELSDRLAHKLPMSADFQAAEFAQIFSEIEQIGVAYWRLYLPECDEISIHNPYEPTFRLPEFYWLEMADAQQRTRNFVKVFLAQFPGWRVAETPDWWRNREQRSDAHFLLKPFANTHLVVNVSLDCRQCKYDVLVGWCDSLDTLADKNVFRQQVLASLPLGEYTQPQPELSNAYVQRSALGLLDNAAQQNHFVAQKDFSHDEFDDVLAVLKTAVVTYWQMMSAQRFENACVEL